MHTINPAIQPRIASLVRRVLIVDSNAHAAELLGECLKAFGAQEVTIEPVEAAAFGTAERVEPTLIFTEALKDADPFTLVRSIRRSSMACRMAPVVVLTTLATASAIRSAKDAGAHEFLRKPFSRPDLVRRLDHLATQPRPWVERDGYVGPDRRLFNSSAAKRRLSDRLELISQGVPATSVYAIR